MIIYFLSILMGMCHTVFLLFLCSVDKISIGCMNVYNNSQAQSLATLYQGLFGFTEPQLT